MGSPGPASRCVVGITHPPSPGAWRGVWGLQDPSLPEGQPRAWRHRPQREDPVRSAKGVAQAALTPLCLVAG